MRYSLFVYLYKMCGSFQEATEYIVKNPGANRQLLSDCVEGLNAVDTVLQKNPESVLNPQVQEYLSKCKLKCQELLNEGADANQEKKVQLSWDMAAFRKVFREGISIQYKVVFFAELGQKWDSMSSVYEAFRARDDCEVAVVITPIFRVVTVDGIKKSDVIYEDYLTPMGIPNIPYEFYDLSKERPDMAFISNPYESVTLEQFWPENIAKYTRLVYLPYFIAIGASEQSIHSYCYMPVADCAWKIIAQSEKMMSLYQRYSKMKGQNVLVTGLPKWDAIIDLRNKPIESDPEWDKKLQGKKVFLWNSHFTIDPMGDSTLLVLGESIINLFSEIKDEVALIWRPHPMTRTIFELYCPEKRDYFEKLKDVVSQSKNMLIDTNNSCDKSFQYSDALISDFSSLIVQYVFMNKPILWLRRNQKMKNYLVHMDSFEMAFQKKDISEFVTRVLKGEDRNEEKRNQILNQDFFCAGEHTGERVSEVLLKEMRNNDGLGASD